MRKWSRTMALHIRQAKCVTSELVAYIEQWLGGLVSEQNYCGWWWPVMFPAEGSAAVLRSEDLLIGGEGETTDLIALMWCNHPQLFFLDNAVAFQLFSVFPSSLCCLPTWLPTRLTVLLHFYRENFRVSVYLTFSLWAWLSVSPVCLSVCCQDLSLTHSD